MSNFQPAHLERIIAETGVAPVVNQVELHPYFQQTGLRREHADLGIVTEAWSPLAQGKVLDDPALVAIAEAHGVTTGQVVIRWHLQLGNVVIPKSVTQERIEQNFDVFGFTLSAAEMDGDRRARRGRPDRAGSGHVRAAVGQDRRGRAAKAAGWHSSLLSPLRPKPFRGDVVAAGVGGADDAGVGGGGAVRRRVGGRRAPGLCRRGVRVRRRRWRVLSPMEGDEPRAYQSVLYVAAVALFIDVVAQASRVLGCRRGRLVGHGDVGAGGRRGVRVGVRDAAQQRRLHAARGRWPAGVAVIAAVEWIWSPDGFATDRWVLLGLTVVFGFAAIGQRDRRPRHGVALIDAAGLAVLAIAASFVVVQALLLRRRRRRDCRAGVAWGWELLILAVGFGLIAYSSVDRQPGPAYLGVLNLIAFTAITSSRSTTTARPSSAGRSSWPAPPPSSWSSASVPRRPRRRHPTSTRPSRRRCRCADGGEFSTLVA